MTNKIIETARKARLGTVLCNNSIEGDRVWIEGADWHDELARFYAIARAEALEDAAQACRPFGKTGAVVAAAIKALKEQDAAIAAGKGEA